MDDCCAAKTAELAGLSAKPEKTIVLVLVINAALFVVEAIAGLLAHSIALLADSLGHAGRFPVYGFSLFVLSRSGEWKARLPS